MLTQIIWTTDNPLEAKLAGRNTKAYIIARFALADGAEKTAELYETSRGAVYAAMSFYEDNKDDIESRLDELDKQIREIGISTEEFREKVKQRMKDK